MSMGRLAGKRAIVTAAAAGIGRATAEAFAREGARVLAVDRDADGLASIPGVDRMTVDLTSPHAAGELLERAGAVDILFNCVGIVHSGNVLRASEAELDAAMDLNVRTAFRLIRSVLPGMIAGGGGSIINVASVAGSLIAVADRCVYGISKAALIGLTKSVALDFVREGVRCNAICPGTVESPSLRQRLAATGDAEAARASFTARQPMGRLGKPEEVAELAVYLAGDAAAFVTGTTMVIDGGWTNA